MTSAGDVVVFRASGIATHAQKSCLAGTGSSIPRQRTLSVSTAGNLALCLGTPRTVVLAILPYKPTSAFAFRFPPLHRTFPVSIANISIFVLLTLNIAVITDKALLAHTFGLLRLGIHEACAMTRANVSVLLSWALGTALLAHEPLLAFADSGAFIAFLLAHTSVRATTDATQSITLALQCTIAAHEPFLADAATTFRSPRHTLSLSRADATFVVLGTCCLTIIAQKAFLALAECDLLHLVVHASTMSGADAVIACSRALRIACRSSPRTNALAFGLAEVVQRAFAILTAHLFAEALGALLGAIVSNLTIVAAAAGLLHFGVEKAGALP